MQQAHSGEQRQTAGIVLQTRCKDVSNTNARKQTVVVNKTKKCKKCGVVSKSKEDMWDHARTHMEVAKVLKCTQCPFVTDHRQHMQYHLMKHSGIKPYKCTKCEYSCFDNYSLNSHMRCRSLA